MGPRVTAGRPHGAGDASCGFALAGVVTAATLAVTSSPTAADEAAVTFIFSMGDCALNGDSDFSPFRLIVRDPTGHQRAALNVTHLPGEHWEDPVSALTPRHGLPTRGQEHDGHVVR